MQLKISDELRAKLSVLRETQLSRLRNGLEDDPSHVLRYCYEEQRNVDGVHLYGSIGFESYLTLDGRILLSIDSGKPEISHPPRETSNIGIMALGISTLALCYNLPEVLELLPARPSDVDPCPVCNGERYVVCNSPSWSCFGERCTCRRCYGLGWGELILCDE